MTNDNVGGWATRLPHDQAVVAAAERLEETA